MSSASRSSVAFSVSSSQLIKLKKSVTSLVFKKVTTIVCVFLRRLEISGAKVSQTLIKLTAEVELEFKKIES